MAEETYKGRRIEVSGKGSKAGLKIDGKAVRVEHHEDGSHSSAENRYMAFRTVHDLARALINQGFGT